jgi:hypothetical protein
MPLQFRRGKDTDRQATTFANGEPVWTTDTNKLYVGDGVTPGGIAVGSSGSNYSLPTASDTILGGIKVGSGLSIDGGGVLSATGGGGGTTTSTFTTTVTILNKGGLVLQGNGSAGASPYGAIEWHANGSTGSSQGRFFNTLNGFALYRDYLGDEITVMSLDSTQSIINGGGYLTIGGSVTSNNVYPRVWIPHTTEIKGQLKVQNTATFANGGLSISTSTGGGGTTNIEIRLANNNYLHFKTQPVFESDVTISPNTILYVDKIRANDATNLITIDDQIVFNTTATFNNTLTVYDVIPATDIAYNLGSPSKRFHSLYVSSSTIYIDNNALSVSNGNLNLNGGSIGGQTSVYSRSGLPTGVTGMIITISDSGSDTNAPAGNYAPAYWNPDASVWTYIGNSNSVTAI